MNRQIVAAVAATAIASGIFLLIRKKGGEPAPPPAGQALKLADVKFAITGLAAARQGAAAVKPPGGALLYSPAVRASFIVSGQGAQGIVRLHVFSGGTDLTGTGIPTPLILAGGHILEFGIQASAPLGSLTAELRLYQAPQGQQINPGQVPAKYPSGPLGAVVRPGPSIAFGDASFSVVK